MNREKIDDLIADYSDAYADSVADMSMHTVRARVAKTYKDLMDYLDELEAEDVALRARVEMLEQMVEKFIGLGSTLIDATSVAVHPKECEEWFDATDEWYGAQQ